MSYTFVWHGEELKHHVEHALSRAAVGWAQQVVMAAKMIVHRVTGTLSRSLHAAPRDYNGAGDFEQAKTTSLDTGAAGAGYELPKWDNGHAYIAAGSWIQYAAAEFSKGGTHDYLSGPVAQANQNFEGLVKKAMGEEGIGH
jgi:hypothetical protein